MAEHTAISWCHHTFNMWWGCWKIADECANCYADVFDHRVGGAHWGRTAPRRFFGDSHWNEPLKWDRKAKEDGVRRRVFVGSMMDWAEIHPHANIAIQMSMARNRLWHLIDRCRNLDWLLLSKRMEDIVAHQLLPWMPMNDSPWPHVWVMTTAGTNASLRKNVPILRSIPAAVRGISCEPLLEDIGRENWDWSLMRDREDALGPIDWLIVGDESGPKRRPARPEWVRAARDAALRHGVAFHFKQWCGELGGGIEGERDRKRKVHLPLLDGEQHAGFPEV